MLKAMSEQLDFTTVCGGVGLGLLVGQAVSLTAYALDDGAAELMKYQASKQGNKRKRSLGCSIKPQ